MTESPLGPNEYAHTIGDLEGQTVEPEFNDIKAARQSSAPPDS
jgi:hypothetical protein